MSEIKILSIIDGKKLLSLEVEPPKFIVSRFFPTGLYILAGSPKISKSWLALWLCHQVSKGELMWEFETRQCGALYISLEDTLDHLHFRLSRITKSNLAQSYFITIADTLPGTLIVQLKNSCRTISTRNLSSLTHSSIYGMPQEKKECMQATTMKSAKSRR